MNLLDERDSRIDANVEMGVEALRLLRTARGVRVPDGLADEIRRGVQARMSPTPARVGFAWRAALAGLLLLIAASAAAQGRAGLRRLWDSLVGGPATSTRSSAGESTDSVSRRSMATRSEPEAGEMSKGPRVVATTGIGAPARSKLPHGATNDVSQPTERADAPTPASPPQIQRPALDWPGILHATADGDTPHPRPPPPPVPEGHLVITRGKRGDVTLVVRGDRLVGDVRGTTVALTVGPTAISGRIGGDAVAINVFGNRRADGHVGGRPVGFTFSETERGWLVGASLPEHGGRVDFEDGKLSFLPGCDRDLAAVVGSPGVYDGTCSDDTHARIEIPHAFQRWPPLARMVVLGLLLPEPDPYSAENTHGLFPPP